VAGVRKESIVAQVSAAKPAKDDLAHLDDAEDLIGPAETDNVTQASGHRRPRKMPIKGRICVGGIHPGMVKPATPVNRSKKGSSIADSRRPEANPCGNRHAESLGHFPPPITSVI
jgi:hypothetical protein